jgi:hypothetical protein
MRSLIIDLSTCLLWAIKEGLYFTVMVLDVQGRGGPNNYPISRCLYALDVCMYRDKLE